METPYVRYGHKKQRPIGDDVRNRVTNEESVNIYATYWIDALVPEPFHGTALKDGSSDLQKESYSVTDEEESEAPALTTAMPHPVTMNPKTIRGFRILDLPKRRW